VQEAVTQQVEEVEVEAEAEVEVVVCERVVKL
jgi:hypothetical protein